MKLAKQSVMMAALLLAAAASSSSCLCSRDETDEERLKKRLDTTSVHVYVALKVALTQGATDPAAAQARDRARALFDSLRASRRSGEGGGEAAAKPGLGDALELGKALWGLRETGARIARGEGDDQVGPLLPGLLAEAGASPELIAAIDANAEHALLLSVMAVLKAHPRSPVPVPVEIVLYEAWKTDPEALKIPGTAAPLHAVKGWLYGTNGFCDLAQTEAAAVERANIDPAELVRGLELLGVPRPTGAEGQATDLAWLDPALEAIGYGAVAICNMDRGDDEKARAATRKLLAAARRAGIDGEELQYLEAYVECGEDDPAAGRKRLERLLAARGGKLADHEDLQVLGAYCEAADATSNEKLRKVVLAAKLVAIAFEKVEQAEAAERFEQTEAFRAAQDVAATAEAIGDGGGLLDVLK
jgi:hypothetical protein